MRTKITISIFLAIFLAGTATTIAEENTEQQLKQRRARQIQQLKQYAPIQQNQGRNSNRQTVAPETDRPRPTRMGALGMGFGQQQGQGPGQGFGPQRGQMQGRRMGQPPMAMGQESGRLQGPMRNRPQPQQPQKAAPQNFNPKRIRNAMQKARQSGDKEQIKKIEQHIKKIRAQNMAQPKGPQQRPIMRQRGLQKQRGQQKRPMMQAQRQGKPRARAMSRGFGPQQCQMQGRRMTMQNRPQGPKMQGRQFARQQRPMMQGRQMGRNFGQMQGRRMGRQGRQQRRQMPCPMQSRQMGQRFGQGRPQMRHQATPPFGNRHLRF